MCFWAVFQRWFQRCLYVFQTRRANSCFLRRSLQYTDEELESVEFWTNDSVASWPGSPLLLNSWVLTVGRLLLVASLAYNEIGSSNYSPTVPTNGDCVSNGIGSSYRHRGASEKSGVAGAQCSQAGCSSSDSHIRRATRPHQWYWTAHSLCRAQKRFLDASLDSCLSTVRSC